MDICVFQPVQIFMKVRSSLMKYLWDGTIFFSPDPESGSDFKLENFLAAPCETFDPHYGKFLNKIQCWYVYIH